MDNKWDRSWKAEAGVFSVLKNGRTIYERACDHFHKTVLEFPLWPREMNLTSIHEDASGLSIWSCLEL